MDAELRAAYEATLYGVENSPGGTFSLRCGEGSDRLDALLASHGAEEWAYVTACNPGSRVSPDEENRQRMLALEEAARGLCVAVYHGHGVGTVGDWPAEPSLLLVGVDESRARELAAHFGQFAILVGKRGGPARLAWL